MPINCCIVIWRNADSLWIWSFFFCSQSFLPFCHSVKMNRSSGREADRQVGRKKDRARDEVESWGDLQAAGAWRLHPVTSVKAWNDNLLSTAAHIILFLFLLWLPVAQVALPLLLLFLLFVPLFCVICFRSLSFYFISRAGPSIFVASDI